MLLVVCVPVLRTFTSPPDAVAPSQLPTAEPQRKRAKRAAASEASKSMGDVSLGLGFRVRV